MEPDNFTVNHTRKQQLVIGLLILMIIGIVAGYIYYGMLRAGLSDDASEIESISNDESLIDDALNEATAEDTLTVEEKIDIMKTLEAESEPSELTEDEKIEIMNDLETESESSEFTAEEKRAILEAL